MKKQVIATKVADFLETVAVKQSSNASLVVLHEPEMPKVLLQQLQEKFLQEKK